MDNEIYGHGPATKFCPSSQHNGQFHVPSTTRFVNAKPLRFYKEHSMAHQTTNESQQRLAGQRHFPSDQKWSHLREVDQTSRIVTAPDSRWT